MERGLHEPAKRICARCWETNEKMIEIDGSQGEGGGQILRTSLALAAVTGRSVRLRDIRARRRRPGLLPQHLTAARAAAEITDGALEGAELGASEMRFTPGAVRPGSYRFAIGTAGSATLVVQTVLPALALAAGPSRLVVEGGTHNPQAPPYPFLERTFLPLVERMGPRVEAELERPGFYPAGGGRMRFAVAPAERFGPLELVERGKILERRATAIVADLPRHIAERELREVARKTKWEPASLHVEEAPGAGPGNALVLELVCENLTQIFTAFGEIRVPAETVARRAVRELNRYLKSGAAVGEHLADQLLLPLALAGRGRFTTVPLSSHAETQIEIVRRFVDVPIRTEPAGESGVLVSIGPS